VSTCLYGGLCLSFHSLVEIQKIPIFKMSCCITQVVLLPPCKQNTVLNLKKLDISREYCAWSYKIKNELCFSNRSSISYTGVEFVWSLYQVGLMTLSCHYFEFAQVIFDYVGMIQKLGWPLRKGASFS
jgi:hypothetical protein